MKRVTIETKDSMGRSPSVGEFMTCEVRGLGSGAIVSGTVVKVEDVEPEKHIPKCDPSRRGRHVTLDRHCKNAMEEESGRTFEVRHCIHCGVVVENQKSSGKLHPEPLKPCPFCGGGAMSVQDWRDGNPEIRFPATASYVHRYQCIKCSASPEPHSQAQIDRWFPTEPEARAAWNRRTP
jgi:hypothetical protein